MFFGYKSEADLREYNPDYADEIIAAATIETRSSCTHGKICVGCINGVDFLYSDGSTDQGELVTVCTSRFQGCDFMWQSRG